MFQGAVPGSIAETSALFVLVGAIILVATGIGSWRIMIGSVIGAAFVGILFNLWGANPLMSFSWVNHLVVGGFAFGVVFMATDPVSAAQTNKGKWVYGILVGVFCILIRVFNPAYPEGVMLAILLMNVFAPTIDHYVIQGNINKRKNDGPLPLKPHRYEQRQQRLYIYFCRHNGFCGCFYLAFTASSLKSLQADNVRKEKMQNILSTIGIETDREKAETLYKKYVDVTLALDHTGKNDDSVDAFKIKLNSEIKKPVEQQRFPLYKAQVDNTRYYIIPLRGSGLWDAIWGYIALKSDINTIQGAVFDHKAETAGLGAEITQQWFMDRFREEKVFDSNGQLVGIKVSKTNNDPKDSDKEDHEVDAISGATITGDGVTEMIKRATHPLPSLF